MFKSSNFLLLLLFTVGVNGEIFNTTRLQQVLVIKKTSAKICLRSLSDTTATTTTSNNVQVVVRLIVESTASDQQFTGGNATIVGLQPHIWHEVTLEHTSRDYIHVLDVTMGEEVVPFHKPNKHRWVTSYIFKEILLLSKGAVEIEDCPDNASTVASNPVTPAITTTGRVPTTVGKEVYPLTTSTSRPKDETVASTRTTTETPAKTTPVLPVSPKTTSQGPGTDAKSPAPTKGEPVIEGEDASTEVNTSKSNLPLIVGVIVGLFILICILLLLLRKCKKKGSQSLPISTAVISKNEHHKDYKSVPNGV